MLKNENDFPKFHTLHTSFEKKLKIFPFENPMSSVSRERAADLKALLEFNLIYYAHVWLLLRVYSILADQALHQKLKNERFVQN